MIEGKFEVDLSPLEGLEKKLVKKIIRTAMREASKSTYAAAKGNATAAKLYGFSAKAVGLKIKSYKESVLAIVGPKSKMVYTRGVYTRGPKKGQPRRVRPSFYAHLMEKGSKRSKPVPYLKPALDTTREHYFSTMSAAIARLVSSELK